MAGVAVAGVVVTVALVAGAATARLRRVDGDSMEPALQRGDVIVALPPVSRAVRERRARRGSLVVLPDPRLPERRIVKRVVGLPGELVEVGGARVEVDGREVRSAADASGPVAGGDVTLVPHGHVYVLGDDLARSTDSRTFGPVPLTADVALALGPLPRRGRRPVAAPRRRP